MRLHFFCHRIRHNSANLWINITSIFDIRYFPKGSLRGNIQYSVLPSSKQPCNNPSVMTDGLAGYIAAVG